MGLDNVDYVTSTFDLHRTLVRGREAASNSGRSEEEEEAEEPRVWVSTHFRSRPKHRKPGSEKTTSRLPVRMSVSAAEVRRMMQALLEAGRRR